MRRWWLYLIVVIVGWAVWEIFILRSDVPESLRGLWKVELRSSTKARHAPAIPQDAEIRALRDAHHLRPLSELEQGKRVEALPNGVYGFSACGESLERRRGSASQLEIQKRHDRIDYYVGYAPRDDIAKYFARQKNFHIRLSPYPNEQAPALFEIPVYFVTQCTMRASQTGDYFDLFVRDIPELQS